MTNQKIKNKRYNCSILWIWAIAILSVSCSNTIYDESIEITNGTWSDSADNIVFNFSISDTNQLYHIFLDVNHKTSYAYQNAYCLVETSGPQGGIQAQVVPLELADTKGNWKGTCNTEVCDRKIPFIVNTKFQDIGDYRISIKQHSRVANLDGINSLRLRVEKAEQAS